MLWNIWVLFNQFTICYSVINREQIVTNNVCKIQAGLKKEIVKGYYFIVDARRRSVGRFAFNVRSAANVLFSFHRYFVRSLLQAWKEVGLSTEDGHKVETCEYCRQPVRFEMLSSRLRVSAAADESVAGAA